MHPELRIKELEQSPESIIIVHYACESWFEVKDRPVEISCIAFREYQAHRQVTLSWTDTQEDQELTILRRYFDYLRDHPDFRFVHWNMNGSVFGFQAIENRYRWLTKKEPPYTPPVDHLVDLDALMEHRYGKTYVDHKKLPNLAALNGFKMRFFLSGQEEADKYAAKDHGNIKRSTEEKVGLLSFLLGRFLAGTLETKNSGPMMLFAKAKIDAVATVLEIAGKLRDVSRQLAKRHDKRPTLTITDEYDLQDLYHSLLRLFFGDVREEEWTPSYAGGGSRIDFVIPEYKLALELKHARKSMTTKELGEQLVVDIENYAKHPDVRNLVCVVFDKDGLVDNPRGIERDLTNVKGNLVVTTRIIDK